MGQCIQGLKSICNGNPFSGANSLNAIADHRTKIFLNIFTDNKNNLVSTLPRLTKDAIVKVHIACVISRAFHVSGLSKEVEEMPMGGTKKEPIHESYETASGPIPYNMTNDYMFQEVLQENETIGHPSLKQVHGRS